MSTARVTQLRPLVIGNYLIVLSQSGLLVAHGQSHVSFVLGCFINVPSVVAMYSKGGGKHGKHGSVTQADNICALSYLGVQVFQHSPGNIFRAVTDSTVLLRTSQFLHITANEVLTVLTGQPVRQANGNLELAEGDIQVYKRLNAERAKLLLALKEFGKRRKDNDDEEE